MVFVALASLVGCATGGRGLARPAPATLPPGSPLRIATLSDGDAWLRHHLMFGAHGDALTLLQPGRRQATSDELLRALQRAIVLSAAGELAESNALLEWADEESERRRVRSVSRTVGTFVLNDRVAAYKPSAGEAAMIPYYRMMNYLALDDVEAAAVEARRIGALLDSSEDAVHRCAEHGILQHLAGLVFESAGERSDALVSLRRANESFGFCNGGSPAVTALAPDLHRLASALGVTEVADSVAARDPDATRPLGADSGAVVLLLERGYVAHLTESAIHVPIFEDEIEGLQSGDLDGLALAAATVTARLAGNFVERGYWGSAWDDHALVQIGHALSGAHVMRFAWPALAEPAERRTALRAYVAGDTVAAFSVGDLSAVAERDLEERRASMLGRMVLRGIAKFLISREVEEKAEDEGGELLGFLTGRIANLAANETERADTRSWTLLPDQISLVRLVLPAGVHDVTIEVVSPSGERLETLGIGSVEVVAGSVKVVNQRIWSPTAEH